MTQIYVVYYLLNTYVNMNVTYFEKFESNLITEMG